MHHICKISIHYNTQTYTHTPPPLLPLPLPLLLQMLMDKLHEDLNRIKIKPYIEKPEHDFKRPDNVVSQESWDAYKCRNDSHLVDSCYGLYRSHITCPTCEKESVTFDVYSSLSLPIPIR